MIVAKGQLAVPAITLSSKTNQRDKFLPEVELGLIVYYTCLSAHPFK